MTRSSHTLEHMSPNEQAGILRALLVRHPELRDEAEQITLDMMSSSSIEVVAEGAYNAVMAVGNEALSARAGKHAGGYVEPSQAAWDLLGEAVQDTFDDMTRRAEMGLYEPAETICCGIVFGLYRARSPDSDGLLGWAPGFPAEEACRAVSALIGVRPPGDRGSPRDRLVETLAELVPDWTEMISWAAERAASK